MPYDIYYHGSLAITPALDREDATFVDDFLSDRKNEAFAPHTTLGQALSKRELPSYSGLLSVSDDRAHLLPESDESREGLEDWLELLIAHILIPRGYSVTGQIHWDASEPSDQGTIHVRENAIEVASNLIIEPGPSWDRNLHASLELLHALRRLMESAVPRPDGRMEVDWNLLLEVKCLLPHVETRSEGAGSGPTGGKEVTLL